MWDRPGRMWESWDSLFNHVKSNYHNFSNYNEPPSESRIVISGLFVLMLICGAVCFKYFTVAPLSAMSLSPD